MHPLEDPAAAPAAPITEDDIRRLVHAFYARIRADVVLGPIFEAHVQDWPAHLAHLCDFWSALLLHTHRFAGAPPERHARLPDLTWPHFQRWLALFHETTAAVGTPALRAAIDPMAERIAANLWRRYPGTTGPDTLPHQRLPEGLERYAQSPVFTPGNLPEKLQGTHTTKAGTWGLLQVREGVLEFTLDSEPPRRAVVPAGGRVVIEPQAPHHVRFLEPGAFQIDFYRAQAPAPGS